MTHLASNKLAALVDRLYDKTTSSSLSWELSSVPGRYATVLGSYVVHIYEEVGSSSVPDICIQIFNSAGNVVDEFNDVDLSELTPIDFVGYFDKMAELYASAGRMASGAQVAIDELLDLLK